MNEPVQRIRRNWAKQTHFKTSCPERSLKIPALVSALRQELDTVSVSQTLVSCSRPDKLGKTYGGMGVGWGGAGGLFTLLVYEIWFSLGFELAKWNFRTADPPWIKSFWLPPGKKPSDAHVSRHNMSQSTNVRNLWFYHVNSPNVFLVVNSGNRLSFTAVEHKILLLLSCWLFLRYVFQVGLGNGQCRILSRIPDITRTWKHRMTSKLFSEALSAFTLNLPQSLSFTLDCFRPIISSKTWSTSFGSLLLTLLVKATQARRAVQSLPGYRSIHLENLAAWSLLTPQRHRLRFNGRILTSQAVLNCWVMILNWKKWVDKSFSFGFGVFITAESSFFYFDVNLCIFYLFSFFDKILFSPDSRAAVRRKFPFVAKYLW